MMVNNMDALECGLEDYENNVIYDWHYEEYDFWCQQVSHFESWWHNNPNSRRELIVYQAPVGAAVAQERL